jgi:hypothetical protein
MLLFAKEEDVLRAKLAYEAKTGLEGALTLFDLYNLLRLDMLFNFKLSLEFKFLLDFHLVFNLDFDLEITIPPIMFPKALYGFAIYGTDVYDPEIPPPRYEPIRIEVFRGPDARLSGTLPTSIQCTTGTSTTSPSQRPRNGQGPTRSTSHAPPSLRYPEKPCTLSAGPQSSYIQRHAGTTSTAST